MLVWTTVLYSSSSYLFFFCFVISVEELKSLTAESITKFVMDNQQYYIDFRKPGHAQKVSLKYRVLGLFCFPFLKVISCFPGFCGIYLQVTTTGKKRQKNDFKDSFKCNPFDSSQQIAMFLALREIFHVPAGSFSVIQTCFFFFF